MDRLVIGNSQRACAEDQRRWRNYDVDKNLDDQWLDALNSLNSLNLISICEGHPRYYKQRYLSTMPHINLRLQDHLMPLFYKQFDNLALTIQGKLIQLFAKEYTWAAANLAIHLNASRIRQQTRRDFNINVQCKWDRDCEAMDDLTKEWFVSAIDSIREMDIFLTGIIGGSGSPLHK